MPGELEKLRVEAYRDEQRQGDPVAVFEVQFNPNAYARAQEIEFESESGAGNTAGPARFKRYKAQDCTLEFTLDGTGASGTVIEVEDQVQAFLKVAAEMDGEIHRPLPDRVLGDPRAEVRPQVRQRQLHAVQARRPAVAGQGQRGVLRVHR